MDSLGVDRPSSGTDENKESDFNVELIAFIHKFATSFGEKAPPFVSASLGEAVRQAFLKRSVDRKPLALYLHRDESPEGPTSTPFCTEFLVEPIVRNALINDFIIWGWDLTNEANRDLLLFAVKVYLGTKTFEMVEELSMSDLPTLITLFCGKVNVEVHSVITWSKSTSVSDVLSHLASTVRKNEESNCTGNHSGGVHEESKLFENVDEPTYQAIVLVRFKLPLGNTLEKRFWLSETFGSMISFLDQEGYTLSNFKLVLLSPRRDMSDVDPDKKLAELRLNPLEQFVLEERKTRN